MAQRKEKYIAERLANGQSHSPPVFHINLNPMDMPTRPHASPHRRRWCTQKQLPFLSLASLPWLAGWPS